MKFVKFVHFVGFIKKIFVTMHGHMNVLLPYFYILMIGLTMATKQEPKHVADLLNNKVGFRLKILHF